MNITEVILVNDCFHRMYSFFLNSVYFIWNAAMSNAAQRIFLWNFSGFRNVLFNGFWQFSCCSFQLAKKTWPYIYRNSYINMFMFSFRSTHMFYFSFLPRNLNKYEIRNFLCSLDVTRNIIRHNSHWALLGSNNATEYVIYILYTKIKKPKTRCVRVNIK